MARMRVATAVLLTRGAGADLEVYLVRRNPALAFFGGYWAFPGGVIDPVDRRRNAGGEVENDDQHRYCAVRELFEETGVLPVSLAASISGDEREALRRELVAGRIPDRWRELSHGHVDGMRPFGRLTTPPFAPVRYRTRFVHAELPPTETPAIVPGEVVDGRFVRPADLLAAWPRGGELVAPPTLYLLELLAGRALEEGLALAEERCLQHEAGRLHRIRNSPGVLMAPLATPTLPPATTTNTYVVGERSIYVVDPATYDEDERARLFELLDDLVSEGREIVGVIPTHHHADHVGSVQAVAERYSAPVQAHPLTLARLPERPRDARELVDGDELALGRAPDGSADWRLEVHHTPGHDRGHLVLVESRYRAALVGDLCSTMSTIVIDPPEGHMATYLASLERMLTVPMGILYPAHGPVHRDAHGLIRQYLAHRREREAKLLGALGEEPRTESDLLAEVYDDVREELLAVAGRSLFAGLSKLAEDGLAEHGRAGWRRRAGPERR